MIHIYPSSPMSQLSQLQPRLYSTGSRSAQDALITASTAPVLELRQNSPQDCSNLIAASVDRATVEISRTIIALNATFSQQLQQASISASNAIKSAENSASSSISIVSQNASSATSSASFSLNLANLAVTSVNSALTNANIALASAQSQVLDVNLVLTSALSASTSDVLRLSSSLSSLEATLVSVKASASTAAALAVMSQQTLRNSQVTTAISIAPIQLAAIVVGTMLASVFLSFATGFVLIRARNKGKRSHSDEKGPARNPNTLLSRHSLGVRTGNSVVIKFSPPTSVHEDHPELERKRSFSTTRSTSGREHVSTVTPLDNKESTNNPFTSRSDAWPLTSSFTQDLNVASGDFWTQDIITTPQDIDAQNTASAPLGLAPNLDPDTKSAISLVSWREMTEDSAPGLIPDSYETVSDDKPGLIGGDTQEMTYEVIGNEAENIVPAEGALEDPFKDPIAETFEGAADERFESFAKHSLDQRSQAAGNTLTDEGCHEQTVKKDATIISNDINEALLEEAVVEMFIHTVEDSAPEPLAFSPVVDANIVGSRTTALPEQSEIISQQDSSPWVQTILPQKTSEHEPVKEPLSQTQDTAKQSLSESRDRTISPLRRNPFVGFLGAEIDSRNPSKAGTGDEERDISPLRRNPPFQGIATLLKEQESGPDTTKLEVDGGEFESRGRSMIRTSDIIEARLSGLAQTKQPHEETTRRRSTEGGTNDSLPASPTHPQHISVINQLSKTPTSPKRKPVAEKQPILAKNSLPLTSSSLSRPVSATSAAAPLRRDESSPLRRNPPGAADLRSVLNARPTASGNAKEFSEALSKFQTLVSQNPQDAVVASNEVTSRAIAGIYIPGSLREQAVRNLSKSRERGAGERQRK
ncbi:hypothetical protein N8I77_009929 [Diaporthe amygdali]|uniref:Uncharacterized protein n=1 Tax=Phomopsis amygdali TaxID=1214568 RepID=A0AAD9S5Z2_PHOAM|nr:hypothetical protein N8I77_009929 [Diaporthe amygdali]